MLFFFSVVLGFNKCITGALPANLIPLSVPLHNNFGLAASRHASLPARFCMLWAAWAGLVENGWASLNVCPARHTAGEFRTVARAHTRLRVATDADIDDFDITRG